MHIEDSSLFETDSSDFLKESDFLKAVGSLLKARIRFSKESQSGERPSVIFKSTGNTRKSSVLFERIAVENFANAQFEGNLFFDDASYLNSTGANLVFKNASVKHISAIDTSVRAPSVFRDGLETIGNDANLSFEGQNNIFGVNIPFRNRGVLNVNAQSKVTFLGKRGILTNDGLLGRFFEGEWIIGGQVDVSNDTVVTGINKGSRMKFTDRGTFNNLPFLIPDKFRLDGTLELHDGADSTVAGSMIIGEKGILILNNSKMFVGQFLVLEKGSEIGGKMNIEGSIINAGDLYPGFSPGIATVTGDYEQQASGSLNIEIGGDQPGINNDLLDVSGSTVLDGALNLILYGDFVPDVGDRFEIVKGGSISGTFSTIGMDPFREDMEFKVEYSDTAVTVEAVSKLKTYESWVSETFSEDDQANESVSGQEANPDSDAWINLLEYIFASDPNQTTYGILPISSLSRNGRQV